MALEFDSSFVGFMFCYNNANSSRVYKQWECTTGPPWELTNDIPLRRVTVHYMH